MDQQPPPFFNRGPSPVAQLIFYALISLSLLIVDMRFKTLEIFRQSLSIVTAPLQEAAQKPAILFANARAYFLSINDFKTENANLRHEQIVSAEAVLRMEQLETENDRLRQLLQLKARPKISGQAAQILHASRDPFSRRVIIDKGMQNGLNVGQPAIDEAGVIGQITRIFPFWSEVTLITDKNQSIPVRAARSGLRSVAFGLGDGQLELRFLPTNADIEVGDILVTSGLDDVFLPDLPVAKVVRIDRETLYSFARIYCEPIAGVEKHSELFVLNTPPKTELPAELVKPAPETQAPKQSRNVTRARN